MKPDYAEAHYNLGVTLKEIVRLDEAEASYRKAIALRPDYAEAHSNLGSTLNELGRHCEGIKEQILGDGVVSFHLKNGLAVL
jgi:tetratricopeptide (TPR) repeat protein